MGKPLDFQGSQRFNVYQIAVIVFLVSGMPLLSNAEQPERIEDNSFLIEEAYNQEAGVVQHINAFQWDPEVETWDYTFTQEWPVVSQNHQVSYTLPLSRVSGDDFETGLGDILLNYRYQAVSTQEVAFAPRFSFILPTGDADKNLGSDALGYQVNLPLSVVLSESLVMHWNLGGTFIPDSQVAGSGEANNTSFNYGASLIYLVTPTLNFMLEMVGASDEVTTGEEKTDRAESFFISPGLRYAINFDSELQIVPGIGVPIGVGPSEGDYGLIAYLSFEHPFKL